MKQTVSFSLNGNPASVTGDGDRMLLWVLRYDFGLTGVKYGCGDGMCGACTVLVENHPVRSCVTPVKDVAGKQVVTIEGLSRGGRRHPLQEAFLKRHAFQCGYCTPGMILSAYALLRDNPRPTREEIVRHMDGDLCRCGSYKRIIDAIEDVASRGK